MKRVIVLLWACLSSTLLLANHWTPDNPGAYAYVMGVTSVVEINEVEQASAQLEVGAFCGTQCRGSQMTSLFTYSGRYLAMITVYGDIGDEISFRLYDHSTGQEVDGIGLTTITFSQNGYGTPLQPMTIGFYTNLNITVTATPANGGTVTGEGSYLYDSECTLTATPNIGYTFINWTLDGNVVSTNPSYTFTVTEAATYVANFQIQSFQITANVSPLNSGTVQGAGTYDYGQTCTLTATPATGYDFVNWTMDGTVVSDAAAYSFTVTEAATYVANFQIQSFEIAASANPSDGGTVQGAGTYEYNASCTLTATAATGYDFVNWTKDGAVVSDEATYSFTVTEAAAYVAHFQVQSYEITASVTPDNAGTVEGMGTYEYGSECTLTATPAEGYVFVSWQRNGVYVSNNASYTFTVTGAAHYVARFAEEGYIENHWTPETAQFPFYMAVTAVVQIDGVEQTSEWLEVGAFCGTQCRGSQIMQEFYVTGRYLAMMNVYGEDGDEFTFRLYDHSVQQEVEAVCITPVAFSQNDLGTPLEPYVLGFSTGGAASQQTTQLIAGWNWWSTYIEQDGINGLQMLENSLGTSGLRIQGRSGSVEYIEYQGTGLWYGTLVSINNEQMFKVRTSEACVVELDGALAQLESHPISIVGGWNWIGYPSNQPVSLNEALGGFTPEPDDVIKGRTGSATYVSVGNFNSWYGPLNTLEPGQGYMYKSNSSTAKTLVYQSGASNVELKPNITPQSNIYVPEGENYADNMLITAVVEMGGEELRSEDYELAAFVGDECRGSVKLMYVEPFDRYVAFLLAFGDETEDMRFVLTDGTDAVWSDESMTYITDGTVGTVTEPATLHFGTLGVADDLMGSVYVYPNPSKGIFCVEGVGIRKVEVVDSYGQVILSEGVRNDYLQINLCDKVAGAYLLRVVTDRGVVTKKMVLVR